ncbi:hypothetical protein RFY14_18225, partial [Acinetobacter baumannii]|nr:hypothetical protein [Acinetobacter baumannii]
NPRYRAGQTVYVTDASRAVGVVANLLGDEKLSYISKLRSEYEEVAERHARGKGDRDRLSLEAARANAVRVDWPAYKATRPQFTGPRVVG